MISYYLTQSSEKIEFWTDSEELLQDVGKYIQNCIDATQWRNRMERLSAPPIRDEIDDGN